jgi:lambda repressor-like predicted transcriptional regulator
MHNRVTIAEIIARATWAGMPVPVLAQRAGLVPSTVYRAMKHGDPKMSTLYAMLAALTAHELALRDHLVGLHPLAGNGGAQAEAPAPHPGPTPSPSPRGGGERTEAAA